MHIEPGVVDGAKMALSWGTAAAAAGFGVKFVAEDLRVHSVPSFVLRSGLALVLTFVFFEVLPHFAVGVSEVHLVFGTTLLLILGAGPAAVGLAGALAIQSLFFAPSDLPMFTVNVTTLLLPLAGIVWMARRMIPKDRAYVDLGYGDVLKLSMAYQGGIVAWVAFWAIYGQGAGAENLSQIAAFGAAYVAVVALEPLVDLAVLAGAKSLRKYRHTGVFAHRLHNPA